ncbi:MAG: hypothetical protein ACTSQF_10805 [Candidatus Heimdallarchaeaceae archaeon]
MKPPICIICDKRFTPSEKGDVIYFKKSKSDIEWVEEMERTGSVGHPPYAEWFCEKHFKGAKELEDLTCTEAMQILRKKFHKK